MSLIWRYQAALVGGFLGMFLHVYLLYGRGDWLQLSRLSNALGAGLIYGHLAALSVLIARDLPVILARRSPRRLVVLVGWIFACLTATIAWWAHSAFFLLNSNPDWSVLLLGGIGQASAFTIVHLWVPEARPLRLLLVAIAALSVFIPIAGTYYAFQLSQSSAFPRQALLYFRQPDQMPLIGILFALLIAGWGHLPLLLKTAPDQ